jgi:hypothetical protein
MQHNKSERNLKKTNSRIQYDQKTSALKDNASQRESIK